MLSAESASTPVCNGVADLSHIHVNSPDVVQAFPDPVLISQFFFNVEGFEVILNGLQMISFTFINDADVDHVYRRSKFESQVFIYFE